MPKLRRVLYAALWVGIADATSGAAASGGFLMNGYGPVTRLMGGVSTALTDDAYAGASNPAKLTAMDSRLDFGVELSFPSRTIERTGADGFGGIYNMKSKSRNGFFYVPEFAFSRRLSEDFAWGFTLYGNGGQNHEFADGNGVPGSSFESTGCSGRPANFLFGCKRLGLSLLQMTAAPALSWQVADNHHLGVSPQITYQRVKIYGFQAFKGLSKYPDAVTNRDNDSAWGGGVRVGYLGEINDWLTVGATYASRIYMQDFEHYKGLFAEGKLDIPEHFALGVALRPTPHWLVGFDVHRVNFSSVRALGNGVLNSIDDPAGSPLGSKNGSGFNWRDVTYFKFAAAYDFRPDLTGRLGWQWGKRTMRRGINDFTFNLMAPNPEHIVSIGLTWRPTGRDDLHFGYRHFLKKGYRGPSASARFGVGGTEELTPYVHAFVFGWTRHL
jgi:long-chain fatty acid transport protein